MKKVLFICMGNICRSPAAEGVFRHLVEERGLSDKIEIDSAGTIGYHAGEPADARMRQAAKRRGYDLTSISRQVHRSDLEKFDYILAADDENIEALERLDHTGLSRRKIQLITDFSSDKSADHVPDPYYGGDQGFEHVMDLLEDCLKNFLDKIEPEL